MATSGWQNEQLILSRTFSSSLALYGNVNISSITHTGTNLRVVGSIALCPRQNGSYGTCTYGYAQYVTPEGGNQMQIVAANTRMVTPGHPNYAHTDYYANFDVTLTGVAATATSRNFTVNFYNPSGQYGYNKNLTWTLNFNKSSTAPSGLNVSISSVADTGATFSVSLSSYGTPSGEANRYIEASILGQSTYGGKYRWATKKAVKSATITVNNNSATNSSNPLTIVPNTKYWYGAYATNTVMSTNTVKGTFITLPAYISDVTANDTGGGNVTVSVIHASEGSAAAAYTEYSYDQTNWDTVQDTFSLTVHSATTIYIRRRNSTGTTPVRTVSIVPASTVKLYGSVNNQAKEIRKLYGSVNGKAVRISKLYGSVNGRSKLIYAYSPRPGEDRENPIVIDSSNATFNKTKHIYANVTESTAIDIGNWYLSPAPVFFRVSIPDIYDTMGVGLNITITIGGEQKIDALSSELGLGQRELLLRWDGSSSLTVLKVDYGQ